MKKFTLLGLAVLGLAGLTAQGAEASSPATFPNTLPVQSQASLTQRVVRSVQNLPMMHEMPAEKPAQKLINALPRKAYSGEITGRRVMTFQTLSASLAPTGGLGTTKIVATDSAGYYRIENFWDQGISVIARIDPLTGVFTISNQEVTTIEGIGTIDIAVCTSNGKPDRNAMITGSVQNDGTILINTWWGIYVKGGTYADRAVGWYHTTLLKIPNGTMKETRRDGNTSTPGEYAIVASQQGNVLTVENFANHGLSVELVLSDDRSAVIESQLAAIDVQHGNIYTAAITGEQGESVILAPTIYTKPSADVRSINWTNWTLRTSSVYFGYLTTGAITTDFDIVYPASTTELQGEGTAASPWQIKSLSDLNYLRRYTESSSTEGKYFAITADIDMSGQRFLPIGTAEHPFAGTLTGNDHALSNLTVERGNEGYAALIAYASATSRIEGVRLMAPRVTATGPYVAALVAHTDGVIANCEVRKATVGSDYLYVAPLAGHATKVENCHVYLSQVAGTAGCVSGMVAELDSSMTNCGASDNIIYSGATRQMDVSGGLVARAADNATISDSFFAGVVSGRPTPRQGQVMGGIVGLGKGISVNRCFFVGTLENYTDEAKTGGIAGSFSGTIADCYAAGRIISGAAFFNGGLAGVAETTDGPCKLASSYVSTVLVTSNSGYDTENICRELVGNNDISNINITNCYFDSNLFSLKESTRARTTAQLTAASGPEGLSADTWLFKEGYYPRLRSTATAAASAQSATAIQFKDDDYLMRISSDTHVNTLGSTSLSFLVGGQLTSKGRGAEIVDNTLKLNGTFASDTLVIRYNSTDFYYHIVKYAPQVFDGKGTAESPYLIKDTADMNRLARITSIDRQPFVGTYFRLTADLDFTGDSTFLGIGNKAYSSSYYFGGTFDGDGHTIRNLKMGKIVWKSNYNKDGSWTNASFDATQQESFKAPFGVIGGLGVVKNLTIDSTCLFEGSGYCAGIAVTNSGRIENCRNYATVRVLSTHASGIVANNAGLVQKCLNAGAVTSNCTYGAGIVANNTGRINQCVNVGDITVKTVTRSGTTGTSMYGGGITAFSTGMFINNCINAGAVYANTVSGGIAGMYPHYGTGNYYNRMTNCVNYGIITSATALVGAIVGDGTTSGIVKGVYFDRQILPIMAEGGHNHSGMSGEATSMLVSGNLPEGYDAEIWQFEKGSYPVLKCLADVPEMKQAAAMVITMNEKEDARNIVSPATLSGNQGITWSLKNNNAFAIQGSQLIAPAEVKGVVYDILTAKGQSLQKQITIARSAPLPLAGDGSEANPWQLSTTADWDTLATFISVNKVDLDGRFIKVMADLDFSGKTFMPISGAQFNATLLGNGHKLKGIEYTCTGGKQGAIFIIGPTGTVKDLTIAGTFTQTKSNYVGAFCGELFGSITNCVNEATVTGNKPYRAGFAAIAYSGARLTDCTNRGTITSTASSPSSSPGGIVAEAKTDVTFLRCINEGSINGGYGGGIVSKTQQSTFIECGNKANLTSAVSQFGGIVGQLSPNTALAQHLVLDRCYNTGDITVNGNVGGILGNASSYSIGIKATGCYNTGKITGKTLGNVSGLFNITGARAYIADCYNTGDVVCEIADKGYISGVANQLGRGYDDERSQMIRCYNTGKITSKGSLTCGVVAQANAMTDITDCYNTGEVTGGTYSVAGMVANCLGADLNIRRCRNEANITGGTNRIGGIVGTSQKNQIVVEQCVNFGNVATTCTLKGTTESGSSATGHAIGGLAGASGGTFIDCYNVGSVKGANQVGGLVGQTFSGTNNGNGIFNMTRCYNVGNVEADADVSGAIIGIDFANPEVESYWSTDCSVTDTYYLEGVSASMLTPVGRQLTRAELATLNLGAKWTSADNYSYPVLRVFADHNLAKVHSAAIHLTAGDTEAKVTRSFNVGCPEGLVWSGPSPVLRIDGNRIHVTNDAYCGAVTLTATAGEHSKKYELYIDKTAGADINDATLLEIVEEHYFTVNGIAVRETDLVSGNIYLVVRKYADGSVKRLRIVHRK